MGVLENQEHLIQGEASEKQNKEELQSSVFMILQVRVFKKLGIDRDNNEMEAFIESHEEPSHKSMSAVLREIIEEAMRSMGEEGVCNLYALFRKMNDPFSEKNKEVESIVDGVAADFLQSISDPRVLEYLRRRESLA